MKSKLKTAYKSDIGLMKFNKVIFSIFLFFAIMMPSDVYNVKLILLAILLIINLPDIIDFFLRHQNLKITLIILVIPIFLSIISIINTGMVVSTIKYYYVYSYIFIIPILIKYQIDYRKIFFSILFIMSLIIVISALLDMTSLITLQDNLLLQFLNNNGDAKISKSTNAIFYYVIFFNASPLLIVLNNYNLYKKKWFFLAISQLSILFTGTRANIYLSLTMLLIYILFFEKSIIIKIFTSLVAILFMLLFLDKFMFRIELINDAKAHGDLIRSLTKESIIINIKENAPQSYIFGTGAASEYFSYGRNEIVSFSELSYWELFRQSGILGFTNFVLMISLPFNKLIKTKKYWLLISLISYLFVSMVDPFLFTSTGFILYSYVYYEYIKSREEA